MQRIIDDTTYNTATALDVATFTDGRQRSDPLHVVETLYRGPKGAWFINRRQGGGAGTIVPQTPAQAQNWLSLKRFDGALARWFGDRVKKPAAALRF
jgi:hypothetical protein